jgi:hypothetical protein
MQLKSDCRSSGNTAGNFRPISLQRASSLLCLNFVVHGMSKAARCLLYSHHIYARSKIKSIFSLAETYHVNGIFKVGRPGYISIEGEEADVKESVKVLKV